MKKILLLLSAFFFFNMYASAADLYYMSITVKVEYYYHKQFEGEYGNYSGMNEYQTIEVCASSPDEARVKAKDQCTQMCQGDQEMGTGNFNGETLPKYKRRSVYDVEISSVVKGGC